MKEYEAESKARYVSGILFMALSQTLAWADITRMEYKRERAKEYVYIYFDRTGSYKKINVTGDSCWGIMIDVVKNIDDAELQPDQ